jgi:hypothetical protein
MEESGKWLTDLGLVTLAPSFLTAFGGTSPESFGISVVFEGADARYRIQLHGVERSAQIPISGGDLLAIRASAVPKNQKQALTEALKQKRQRQINSAFSAVLDIDAFLLEPDECDPRAFVERHANTNLQRFREAVAKDTGKKGK